MTQLLDFRRKLVEIYQKFDYLFKPLAYFLLSLFGYISIKNTVGLNARLSSFPIIFVLALISAFLPASITIAIMVIYIALQVYGVSMFMSATVLVFAVIIFCFFLRFTPKQAEAVIAMPILMGLHIPYVIPIAFGLLASPITIIPTCVGVFAYYFLIGIKNNTLVLEQAANSSEPYVLFTNVLTNVLKNEAMMVTMVVFALVIIVVYIIRNIKMDYSFEISIGVGAAANMLGFIILMLKYNVGVSLVGVILFSILSAGVVYIINFMYRPLFYAGTENVQFEDDDYYYYVKAIPKIKIAGSKDSERHIITRRNIDDDEDDEEEIEDIEIKLMEADSLSEDMELRRKARTSESDRPVVRRPRVNKDGERPLRKPRVMADDDVELETESSEEPVRRTRVIDSDEQPVRRRPGNDEQPVRRPKPVSADAPKRVVKKVAPKAEEVQNDLDDLEDLDDFDEDVVVKKRRAKTSSDED